MMVGDYEIGTEKGKYRILNTDVDAVSKQSGANKDPRAYSAAALGPSPGARVEAVSTRMSERILKARSTLDLSDLIR